MVNNRRHASVVVTALAAVLVSAPAVYAESRLVTAVKAQEIDAVRLLLRQRTVPVNAVEADGSTALHWAVRRNNRVMTEALIAAGANVNVANDYGVTPLWLGCSADAAIAGELLTARANPNAALTNGETLLMRCAYTGNTGAVRLLLTHGANVNARGGLRQQTALMWAASERHADVVRLLIEAGADVRARSAVREQAVGSGGNGPGGSNGQGMKVSVGGFSAFLFAARQGDTESARLLLAAGADINDTAADGASALVIASQSSHTAHAEFLLANGADPNSDGVGFTALHVAVLRGDLPLVKSLLARGANPSARIKKASAAARYSDQWFFPSQVVGATPFFLSAQYAEPDIMRTLVASGADTVTPAGSGTTPLMAAAGVGWQYRFDRRGRNLSAEVLNAEIEQEDRTLEVVRMALDAGSDINAATRAGETALHGAAVKGLQTVYDFLASRGANVGLKNKSGRTALDLLKEVNLERR